MPVMFKQPTRMFCPFFSPKAYLACLVENPRKSQYPKTGKFLVFHRRLYQRISKL